MRVSRALVQQRFDWFHNMSEVMLLQYIPGAETQAQAPHLREKARMPLLKTGVVSLALKRGVASGICAE
jgi:hypothetical protein